MNNVNPPKEVGLDKLYLHHEKLQSILKMHNDVDFTYPINIELSFTNKCNLQCVYCSDRGLRQRQEKNVKQNKDVLFSLFDDVYQGGTKGIVIEGGGEPCLHPDFDEIVKFARKTGLALGLITNGTQEISNELLSCFEWIRVSLDASTSEEYFKLKKVDCFEKVMENIYTYTKHCDTVGVGFVVTNSNTSDIETLVLRLRENNVSYIQFRPVVDCDALSVHDLDLSGLLHYQTSSFGIMIDGMNENRESGNYGLPCQCHSLTSVVSADGSVYICGRLNIHNWLKPIGNINNQSFRNIWHGAERVHQIEMVRNSEFCKKYCPQCRISKFNKLINELSLMKTKNFI